MITDALKEVVKGYINNSQLTDVEVAEVTSVNPISVRLFDIPEPLGSDFLMVPERLIKDTYYIYMNDSTTVTKIKFDDEDIIKQGDKVVVVRAKGGQKYLIIDKVV